MQTLKLKKGTSRLTDLEFVGFVQGVMNNMSGNTHFPTPSPTEAVVEDKRTAMWDIMVTILDGNGTRQDVRDKNALRNELEACMTQWLAYVNSKSTDITILQTSGFPLSKEPAPIGNLPKPTNFSVRSNAAGSATLRCKAVYGADSYLYQYTLSPSPEVNNWVNVSATACRTILTGLTQGACYKFRMCGVGAKGCGQWSDAINCYIS